MIDKKKLSENEEKLRKKRNLMDTYGVVTKKREGGIDHVNCVSLAKMIMNNSNFHFHTIEDIDSGKQEIYYYENGMYYPGGTNRIKELVDDYLDDNSSINRKNEVVDYIKHRGHSLRRDIEPPLNLINLSNGVYDIEQDKLLPHSHKYYFLQQIPIHYNPDADCPKIKKFFKEVVYPKYIPVIQEMFGYLLYRDYFLHVAFLLLGGGRNGKGTTINLMAKFLGEGNYSTRELHNLVNERFSKSSLYGKLANLGAEVSGKALYDTGIFKNLTGGEPITGERKHHGAFTFKNYAKLVFNANHIPYTKFDKSFAFFQRWVILVFPETFELGGKKTDPKILEKISTPEELSGLFNWSIEGLKRLLCKYRFSVTVSEEEAGEWYEQLAYPEKRFISEYLEEIEGPMLRKEEVYDKYESWARKRGYPVQTVTSFTRTINKTFKKCQVTPVRLNGKVKKVYKNINWKLSKIDEVKPKNKKINDEYEKDFFIPKKDKLEHVEKQLL